MYVCVCRAVTERQIEAAVKGGARHLRDLRSELGIIEDCGRCARCAKQCMDKAIEQLGPPLTASRAQPSSSFIRHAEPRRARQIHRPSLNKPPGA